MGDSRRFSLFAALVARQFPDRSLVIADVAGGKGGLRAALHQLGYRHVTTIDTRHRLAKGRPGQRFQSFDYRSAPDYQLVLGLHPDEATDHIVLYGAARRRPFVVCPCCIKPDAAPYRQRLREDQWLRHLKELARGCHIQELTLPMRGKNRVLVGRP